MPILRIYCLGSLEIHHGDQPLAKPPTIKSQSLLAYLVFHRDRPQPRELLAGLFWGDRPERKARRSLTTALWHIRRSLPHGGSIISDARVVRIDPEAELWLDADKFESLVSRPDVSSIRRAVALYKGHLLEGFYDDWILPERYRLDVMFQEALARLMAAHETRAEYNAALASAQRLLHHDPLREDAHRVALRAYYYLGQRTAALEQYQRCRKVLKEELNTEPSAETNELHEEILAGSLEMEPALKAIAAQEIVEVSPVVPRRSPLDAVAPSLLVGREDELAFLASCWSAAGTGHAGLVLISGEAGVGKTRLVEELANRLRGQGGRVLWGRCYEFERTLPYQPIAEALRFALPTLTPDEATGFPDWILAQITWLVPDLAEVRSGLEPALVPDSSQRPTRLFESIARFLAGLASHGALLLVLEDLHWASESTLQLLHYLARHLVSHPVLIVGTSRPEETDPQHSLQTLRRRWNREGLARDLVLSRLSPQAIEALVVEMSGAGEAVVPLARRLYRETEGNPFFLMELLKALFVENVIYLQGGVWRGDFQRISQGEFPLPVSLSEAVQGRVSGLDRDTQEAVCLAAVLGREFDYDLLEAAWSRDEEATLTALENLLRRRLIAEGTDAAGRDYAFTHHKIQEVIYGGLPRRRRQFLHGRVGATLEQLFAAEIDPVVGELAHHFDQARVLDPELADKATAYLERAGDEARRAYAHQEAINYYQRALALLKEQGKHERAARMLMQLGLTYHNAFDFQQSRQAYQEGSLLWQQTGDQGSAASLPPAPHALRVSSGLPSTLDPTLCIDLYSFCAVEQIFSGLMAVSPNLGVVPAVARTWEISEGGRKYVFHLRGDARWSDGVPVTAPDFVYAWRRMLNPASEVRHAVLLYDIKGARAYHQGEVTDPGCVAVRAVHDHTLVVELEEPTGYFLNRLAALSYPLPRHVVEACDDAWTEVGNLVTNGPFKLESWQSGDSMVLVRNPEYKGLFTGNVQQVELAASERTDAESMYEDGRLDVLDLRFLPPSQMDRMRQRHAREYLSVPWLMTAYISFDLSRPPFDDVRVRRALALATDRETLAGAELRGSVFPATGGFLPPGMPGHSPDLGLPYDLRRARRLLAEAGYPGGHGFPTVCGLTYHEFEPLSSYLQAQWRENLGVEITWQIEDFGVFIEKVQPVTFLALGRWIADYPDPDDFLRVCPRQVQTNWWDDTYSRLVEKAMRTSDLGKRLNLYGQADRILIEEASILPLFYGRSHLLVKPWVRRYPTSAINWWFWKDVIIEPH